MEVDSSGNVDAITGMGFDIPLPDGLTNGVVQRLDNNGAESMINATFDIEGLTAEQFVRSMHDTLTSQGFTYLDLMGSGATEPNFTNPEALLTYMHPDGYQFSIIGSQESTVMGLTKTEETTTGQSDMAVDPAEVIASFDGEISIDKENYNSGEAIEISLVINTVNE